MLEKDSLSRYWISFYILLFVFSFIFLASYYREPLGDDVLLQFTNAHTFYQDNVHRTLGPRIEDFPLLIESVKIRYWEISGRIIGYILLPLLTIFGKASTSILTSLFFIGIILNAGNLIYGSYKKILQHPAIILLLFIALFYFNSAIGYLLMWTFVSIYIFSLLLLSSYMIAYRKIISCKNEIKGIHLWGLIVLGVLAGLTHEVYAFTFLIMALLQSSIIIYKNKLSYRRLYLIFR